MKTITRIIFVFLTLLLVGSLLVTDADARGGRGGHGGHGGHGGNVGIGLWLGPGWWPGWGWPGYYPSYYYPSYQEPPIVIQQEPEIYVQPAPQEQLPTYWYYCKDSQGYYPYVKQCPGGWMKVVPTPPGQTTGPPE